MARRPSRADAARARAAAAEASLPIQFTADYTHVEPARTIFYKAGTVSGAVPAHIRKDALAKRKAVVVKSGK